MLRRIRRGRVLVWDANPFNPYGAEVSRVIAAAGHPVTRYCRREMAFSPSGVRERAAIPNATGGDHSVGLAVRHFSALARFCAEALLTRSIVVLPWTETHERPAFVALARLGIRVLLVVHNPVAGRDEAEHDLRLAKLRRMARRLIVHTERLRVPASLFGEVSVAPHPSYLGWVRHMERVHEHSGLDRRVAGEKIALYLGSARSDKGFETLPDLATLLASGGLRLRAAVGMMTDAQRAQLLISGDVDVPPRGTRYLSDTDVYQSILGSNVLVAPYQNVTVSGTTIMAVTMGLPVVAFDSPGMADLLDDASLVEPGDLTEMAARAARLATQGSEHLTSEAHAARLDSASSAAWSAAIESVAQARSGRTE